MLRLSPFRNSTHSIFLGSVFPFKKNKRVQSQKESCASPESRRLCAFATSCDLRNTHGGSLFFCTALHTAPHCSTRHTARSLSAVPSFPLARLPQKPTSSEVSSAPLCSCSGTPHSSRSPRKPIFE